MKVEITESTPKTEKKVVAVQLPIEVYESLLKEAEEDFISVSDVMRRIIIKHYRKREQDNAKLIDSKEIE